MFRSLRGPVGRLFLRFFLPFVLISVLNLAFGLFAYHQSRELIEEEISQNTSQVLLEGSRVLDSVIAQVGAMVDHVATDPAIAELRFFPRRPPSEVIPAVLRARTSLYNYPAANPFVELYFIALGNLPYLLAPRSVYDVGFFVTELLRPMNAPELDLEWLSAHDGGFTPVETYSAFGARKRLILHVRVVGVPAKGRAIIVVALDADAVLGLFSAVGRRNGGAIVILDRRGTVVARDPDFDVHAAGLDDSRIRGAAVTEGIHVNGARHKVFARTSSSSGWTYVALQPFALFEAKVRYIRNIAWVCLVANLFLGLIVALYSAYTNTVPLGGMLLQMQNVLRADRRMDSSNRPGDPLKILVEDSVALQRRLLAQAPFVRAAFARRVLSGGFGKDDPVTSFVPDLPSGSRDGYFAVLALQLRRSELDGTRVDVRLAAIQEAVESCLAARFHLSDIHEDGMRIIVYVDADSDGSAPNSARALTLDLAQRVDDALAGPFSIGVGLPYQGLHNAYRSFGEAQKAMRHGLHYAIRIQYFEDLPTSRHMDYPTQLEEQLVTSICAGKLDRTKDLLRLIRDRNTKGRRLEPEVVTLLMGNLLATALKAEEAAGLEPDDADQSIVVGSGFLSRPLDGEDTSEFFGDLEGVFAKICARVEQRKRSHNSALARRVESYIQENYADSLLSLESVADQFGMSRYHLSQFFKEQTGENFSSRIERLRTEAAKELLAGTDLPVHEIVERTGYASPNSFARAFKRSTGTTATEYRESFARSQRRRCSPR